MKETRFNLENPATAHSATGKLPYEKPELTEIELVAFDVLSTTCNPLTSADTNGVCYV